MPKTLPATCRHCGKKRLDGWYISRRGKCDSCAMARFEASVEAGRRLVPLPDNFPTPDPRGGG